MLEALNRKTLEWEPLPLKGRHLDYGARFSDDTTVTSLTALAIRGKEQYRGYGYCSRCHKIMTKNEFEKHNHVYADKKCIKCIYFAFNKSESKCSCDKNKSLVYKTQGLCCYSYQNKTLTKDTMCPKDSCNGNFIPINKEIMNKHIINTIPKEILTIGAMVGNKRWAMSGYKNDYMIFKNKYHNRLTARFDNRGFLLTYVYKKSSFHIFSFIYRTDIDEFCLAEGNTGIAELPDKIKQEIRRIYI